ncbi:glutathione synthetase large chain, partial [Hortaea werneckii]
MASSMYPDYPPDLDAEQQKYLLQNVEDWSIAHGLAVRPAATWVSKQQDPAGALATTAPVTMFPSLFPEGCFDQAKSVAKSYNELYSAIASNESWLKEIVEELVEIDEFMAELWKVHLAVKKQGYVQPLNLGLFRSDYMVHVDASDSKPKATVKQVEFNTIASSFGGLSSQVSAMHRHLLSIDAYPESTSSLIKSTTLPQSTSVPELARGMAVAHDAYGKSSTGLPTCVIFLVQDPERNVFDQRHLEYALNSTHAVKTFRLTFARVLADTEVNASRKLIYSPPHAPTKKFEVSLVYFRAGYAPSEYHGKQDWDARLHIERSAAIKCPSILTHLAGTKKVQQVLATP